MNRNRCLYLAILTLTIAAGLASRKFSGPPPNWVHAYLGDTLWAFMVFLIIGMIFPQKNTIWIAVATLMFSYGIEISQLYHAPWIDALRGYRLGGLVLGYGFLRTDLLCYALGAGMGVLMEKALNGSKRT